MRNYKTAFYEPALSDRKNVESWEEEGSNDIRTRTYERWSNLLDKYEPPPIDEATDEALRTFIAKKNLSL